MTHQEENNGKLLSNEEAFTVAMSIRSKRIAGLQDERNRDAAEWACPECEARKERNREGIEKMFAAMNKLNTPKRGELHRLLIQLFS